MNASISSRGNLGYNRGMSDELREPHEATIQPSSIFEVEAESRSIRSAPRPPKRRLALILFVLTCASTFYAGSGQFPEPRTVIDPATGKKSVQVGIDPSTGQLKVLWRRSLLNGLTYAAAVLVMLGAHEMGHYLQARRYHVPASLPLFIPMPIGPVGTMGAVIVQQAGTADRKSMFDIAISGPLAGLAIALPLNWWGIQHSHVGRIPPNEVGFTNPLIVEWMIGWIHKPLQAGEDIALNPILFAGWVGIFITGLNLLPIGQLDGGHILYCLVGKKAHFIARALYLGAISIIIFQALRGHEEYLVQWMLMLTLIWFMGTKHPPTANDHVPLGPVRIVLGWLTLAFILIGFVPTPMYESKGPAAPPRAPIQQSPEKDIQV
jgi:Zn-dependent protease